ncbi:MAG: saccharopine dehydrogenase C-terminal domain-containing protein [Thermoplasmata archaeon]|nr:saccharopine dehydrogenase C-terminal domain-containing protein [Thermoplasmata archaeon]
MITVLGAGNIGFAIIDDLYKDFDVAAVDVSKKALDKLPIEKKYLGDVVKNKEIIERSDLIISALPGSIAFDAISKLLKMGKNVVDVSYMPEDPYAFKRIVEDNKLFLIPDAGFAPGLSNIISGYLYKTMKKIEKIEIYVAGLPLKRIPPLDYTITWNVEGLIDEYTRKARYIKNGKIVSIDPLENIEPFCISSIGSFESFYSDGLRTMLKTIKIKNIFEKTLRYPSHLEKIKLLKEMGYFSTDEIDGCVPRELSIKLFKKLEIETEDISILLVRGFAKNTKDVFVYDKYDKEKHMTSMSRMTGYTAAIISRIALENEFKGIMPPEKLGFDKKLYEKIKNEMKKRDIFLNETI